ncbi:hypothetical protein O9G_001356 [Rozella allomycis CSF55]|uniref:Uncharacterized protein n=1 Tax=Rozella allomycis (strain CSF55) TaxID=988480 RepID=A0A075AV69_ROZAC|nr:hypothetical protein O9G_001356 [Rozella allomycis CSF55]|eukprot:EPZ32454.1 hypothetical protein O9G_001356 [Rozella allomycis CSF55]
MDSSLAHVTDFLFKRSDGAQIIKHVSEIISASCSGVMAEAVMTSLLRRRLILVVSLNATVMKIVFDVVQEFC